MAYANSALLKTPTMLEQLLEEINFQRTKEMRQLLKDDSGFVMLQGTTYWTDLFVRHFLFQDEHAIDCDDLLFFVRKKHVKSSSRYLPKFETEVDVFRKDSRKLPIGDPDVDWEETVYLNLIIHQFDYTLTLAICTRTSPKELQVLRRHSQKVYASPSRRRMDTKGEVEEMTYPHICFMVDNFDEVFCDILVRDGEMVCVELVASDRDGAIQGVIFLGSIRYDALKKVYDARQSSLSTKMAQRMTFGLFSSGQAQRCEFVRMKGPQGKGHAEMAVTKPKGSGVETPTSEPGYCVTDMWDSDWDSDPEEFYTARHQRRLSDPSANLNNFVRGGWKTKTLTGLDSIGARARSENEGLDCIESGVSEIEAGDVRDDLDRDISCVHRDLAASSSQSDRDSDNCCCWRNRSRRDSLSIMSDIYCRSPAANVDKTAPQLTLKTLLARIELADDATPIRCAEIAQEHHLHKVVGNQPFSRDDFEFADDAISLNGEITTSCRRRFGHNETDNRRASSLLSIVQSQSSEHIKSDLDAKHHVAINVNGKEELPTLQQYRRCAATALIVNNSHVNNYNTTNRHIQSMNDPRHNSTKTDDSNKTKHNINEIEIKIEPSSKTDDCNGNDGKITTKLRQFGTLPKVKGNSKKWQRYLANLPHRITPDGTDIYYWCDLPKKELDDGQYNPLWTMKGCSQTFHFWKENKRAQSVPLNAFLTYVTLPWWSIAKDILDHREGPILTF